MYLRLGAAVAGAPTARVHGILRVGADGQHDLLRVAWTENQATVVGKAMKHEHHSRAENCCDLGTLLAIVAALGRCCCHLFGCHSRGV